MSKKFVKSAPFAQSKSKEINSSVAAPCPKQFCLLSGADAADIIGKFFGRIK